MRADRERTSGLPSLKSHPCESPSPPFLPIHSPVNPQFLGFNSFLPSLLAKSRSIPPRNGLPIDSTFRFLPSGSASAAEILISHFLSLIIRIRFDLRRERPEISEVYRDPQPMASAAAAALNKIERAHQLYREGSHEEALGLYTEALALAKNKAQKIALHSNRAACYLKLHEFKKAAEECTSVLELDHQHTGALMLRAQTLVTLKDYQSALFDVNRLMELNPSSDVYRNLQARLRTQLSLAPIPESEEESVCPEDEGSALAELDKKNEPPSTNLGSPVTRSENPPKAPPDVHPKGWEAIPKPKGHSGLDYSRWDTVEDGSSDEEDEDEEQQPQYRFRVRTVGVRPVK